MPEYLSAEEVEIWVHDCEKTAVDGDNQYAVTLRAYAEIVEGVATQGRDVPCAVTIPRELMLRARRLRGKA
jgi:hypothetical protein